MSSEELRAIAHDDPKYLEASRNELAMRQIAADARIRDLERQLDTSNAKNACKDVEIKALSDKLETSTKKATRLKSKYQNSQLACGDGVHNIAPRHTIDNSKRDIVLAHIS